MKYKIILMISIGIFFFLASSGKAHAADFYIRQGATGNASGSDWTNAATNTPKTWIRGNSYYYASGSYTGLILNTPESGTSPITIKKATASDHGTDSGWSDSYSNGQAVFGRNNYVYVSVAFISTGYWIIDGVTGGGPDSWTSGYGFRFLGINTSAYLSYIYLRNAITNVILSHIEIGPDSQSNPGCDDALYSGQGADKVTLRYSYLKNMGDVGMTITNGSGWVIEYNRFDKLGRYGPKDGICGPLGQMNHGTGLEFNDTDDLIIRYNNMSNSEASGWIGYYGLNAFNNVRIYGNIFHNTSDYSGSWGNGVIYNVSGAGKVTNLKIYNNTFANLQHYTVLGISHDTSGNEFKNNLVYNVSGTAGYVGCERDYNASDQPIAGDFHLKNILSDPFVNSANDDFRIVSSAIAKNNGFDLGSDFAQDAMGIVRPQGGAWDIGAYEYVSLIGDLNSDGSVNGADFNIFLSHYGSTQSGDSADFDSNGKVDIFDYNILLAHHGKNQ